MTDSNKTTRLGMIEDDKTRNRQARLNDEMIASSEMKPIQGEEGWSDFDYRLQIEYYRLERNYLRDNMVEVAKGYAEEAVQKAMWFEVGKKKGLT